MPRNQVYVYDTCFYRFAIPDKAPSAINDKETGNQPAGCAKNSASLSRTLYEERLLSRHHDPRLPCIFRANMGRPNRELFEKHEREKEDKREGISCTTAYGSIKVPILSQRQMPEEATLYYKIVSIPLHNIARTELLHQTVHYNKQRILQLSVNIWHISFPKFQNRRGLREYLAAIWIVGPRSCYQLPR